MMFTSGSVVLPVSPPSYKHQHPHRNADSLRKIDRHLPGPDPSSPVLQCRRSVKLP